MSDFSQNGIISTLHDFNTKSTSVIEDELAKFSKQRKMELILPCLYSELEGDALPKIIEEISRTKYLDHIIIGLDKANEAQAKKAWKFFKKLKTPFSILWNDGPELKKLDLELKKKDLAPNELGKGRNVWYCIGMCIARDSAVQLPYMIVISRLMTEECSQNYFIQLKILFLILNFVKDTIQE